MLIIIQCKLFQSAQLYVIQFGIVEHNSIEDEIKWYMVS